MVRKYLKSDVHISLLIFSISVVVCLFVISGCTPLASELDPNDKSFTVAIPKGWRVQRDSEAAVFAINPPQSPSDRFEELMMVFVEIMPINCSVKNYLAATKNTIRAEFPDMWIVEEGTTYFAEKSGKYIVFEFMVEGIPAKGIAYMAVQKNKAYVLVFSTVRDDYDKFRVTFDKTRDSFKIDKY